MENRAVLLKRVQVCNFVLVETGLFLDTHPTDQMALAYFKKYQALMKAATDEFESKYGPLTAKTFEQDTTWKWIDNPWPWDMEAN